MTPDSTKRIYWHLEFFIDFGLKSVKIKGFCPGVLLHKGMTIVLSLFRSHCLAVLYCLVLCGGSCEPVHEDRTNKGVTKRHPQSN